MSGTRRLRVLAGSLMLGYLVLTFAGAVFEPQVVLGDSPSKVSAGLVTSSLTSGVVGGYVEVLAAVVFMAAASLLARLLRKDDDEMTDWLSWCAGGLAAVYVALTLMGGASGFAAMYDGHNGVTLGTITTVNDIRNVAFSVSGGVAGAFVLAVSVAARCSGALPRWMVYAGYLVGLVCLAAVPAAKAGAPQTLLWFAWLLMIAVGSLRRSGSAARADELPAVATR